MTKYIAALLILACSLTFSCQTSPEHQSSTTSASEPKVTQPEALTFEPQHLIRPTTECKADTCANLALHYFTAKGGPAPLRDSLNRYMQHYLLRLQLMNNPDADLSPREDAAQLIADQFMQQHSTFKAQHGPSGASLNWLLKVSAEVIYQIPSLVSVHINNEGYLGGAHGFRMITLQSYDSTGHALRLTELVTDTVQFRKRVEQEFRKVRKLGSQSWEEQGFYTQGGNLPFPENAALTAKGLRLYYNAYEVNAYAYGPTDLFFPYAQLNHLLKAAYLPKL